MPFILGQLPLQFLETMISMLKEEEKCLNEEEDTQ